MSKSPLVDLLLTAKMQGLLASGVYAGEGSLKAIAEHLGAEYRYVEHGNACAGAFIFHDWLHISIGGTNDRMDWALNTETEGVSYCGLTAHKGFVRAANWLHTELVRVGLDREAARKPLVIGGHSAGGAIAELLSMRSSFEPDQVVTFGAPRVFAADSAATYQAFPWETHRFVMDGDPVPHLPIRGLGWLLSRPEYSHASRAIYLSSDGKLRSGDSGLLARAWRTTRTIAAWSQAATMSLTGVVPSLVRGHKLPRYNSAIEKGLANADA
jgi:hypothetical protein